MKTTTILLSYPIGPSKKTDNREADDANSEAISYEEIDEI